MHFMEYKIHMTYFYRLSVDIVPVDIVPSCLTACSDAVE